MGKRRSSAYALQRRIKETFRQLKIRRLKSRSGLTCPKCYHPTMFVTPKGRMLVLVGCTNCQIGDVLPRHPTFKTTDMYHVIADNWRSGKIPLFHYDIMRDSVYEFLREHITLGKIKVDEVLEDEESDN